jgi:hypothetical protein
MKNQQFNIATQKLHAATSVAVITGAGVSAESGIPTFRGSGACGINFRLKIWLLPKDSNATPGWCGNGTPGAEMNMGMHNPIWRIIPLQKWKPVIPNFS